MSNKQIEEWKSQFDKNVFTLSKIKSIHPVTNNIVINLSKIDIIEHIKVSDEYILASNKIETIGRNVIPITKTGQPGIVGVHLLLEYPVNQIQFYEITSGIKRYGETMVKAVVDSLPEGWIAGVVFDWSDGFWEKMKVKYSNIWVL
jgi:hypothetical protein